MIRIILFMMLSIPAFAKTYVIEIADFACKYCREAEHYTDKLRLETEKNGDEFIFAPAVFNKGKKAEELFYYSLRNDAELEIFAREAMFILKQEQRIEMAHIEELIDWLKIYYAKNETLVDRALAEYKKSLEDYSNIKAYIKAAVLIDKEGIKKTPTFVVIDDTANIMTIQKPEKMPVPEYIDHVLDMYKRISKNAN